MQVYNKEKIGFKRENSHKNLSEKNLPKKNHCSNQWIRIKQQGRGFPTWKKHSAINGMTQNLHSSMPMSEIQTAGHVK